MPIEAAWRRGCAAGVLMLAGLSASRAEAQAPQITVSVGAIEGQTWRAADATVTYAAGADLRVEVASAQWAGRPAVKHLSLACATRRAGGKVHCDGGRLAATLPAWGAQDGTLTGSFTDTRHWQIRLGIPRRGLSATLDQVGPELKVSARLREQPAQDLRALAGALGAVLPGELSGAVGVTGSAVLSADASTATVKVDTTALTWQEPSGRHATQDLVAHATARWESGPRRWTVQATGRGGLVYVEPIFVDFGALPAQVEVVGVDLPQHWRIEHAHIRQGDAGTLDGSGLIAKAGPALESADIRFNAPDLAQVFATDVQPFLIGSAADGQVSAGTAQGTLTWRAGGMSAVTVTLADVALDASRIGLAAQDLSGALHWAGDTPAPSALQWSAGTIGRIPLGPSRVAFRTHGHDFELLAPWRQPLLGGALRVERLALRDIGGAQLDADFRGALEPIDLAALCAALDWPEFGGTLAGQLPGLTVRDDVWSIDGTLEAQVFDGTLRLESLQAIEPFGALPVVTGDVYARRMDLEAITGTFAFGRITGRLDGDIRSLRLLDWTPVAFDARLYSTPGDTAPRRISQRAIDSISAIGGGPTGLLSRGFLGLFKDFSYDRIGIGCVLRDGRCRMDGIEPVRAQDDSSGYYLVKGRLIPRIDVVGYSREVSWDTLVAQVDAAIASGAPRTQE